jgi:hypothetical protein
MRLLLALVVVLACMGLVAGGKTGKKPAKSGPSGPLGIPEFMIYGEDARFSNLSARNDAAWEFASVCGFDASDYACNPKTDAKCGKKGASKPMWSQHCSPALKIGNMEAEYQVRFGKPERGDQQCAFGMNLTMFAAPLPAGERSFLAAKIKFFNAPIIKQTAVRRAVFTSTIHFRVPEDGGALDDSPTIPLTTFDMRVPLVFHYYDGCDDEGCPWNDPQSWEPFGKNKKCKDNGRLEGSNVRCCPYNTPFNPDRECAIKVQIADNLDHEDDPIRLNGKNYQLHIQGFHEDHGGYHDPVERLWDFFLVNPGEMGSGNLHVQLVDVCPHCPNGIQQQNAPDGVRCKCLCNNTCEHPKVLQPDCSCAAMFVTSFIGPNTTTAAPLPDTADGGKKRQHSADYYASAVTGASRYSGFIPYAGGENLDGYEGQGISYKKVSYWYHTADCQYRTQIVYKCDTQPVCRSNGRKDGCGCLCKPGTGSSDCPAHYVPYGTCSCIPDPCKGACDSNACYKCDITTAKCTVRKISWNDFCEICDPAKGVLPNHKCDSNKCYDCNYNDGSCTVPKLAWNQYCEQCDPAVGVVRSDTCAANKCYDCNYNDGSCTVSRDPTCMAPEHAPPTWDPAQNWECNKWTCDGSDGTCVWVGDASFQCSKYGYPLDATPKDWQCWQPECVMNGEHGECRGKPALVAPDSCPVPAGVSPYCYVPKCEAGPSTGYCITKPTYTGVGGINPGDAHTGNCPMPPEYDPRCYWPYCDLSGNCAGDILTGTPFTKEGNWIDGTQGVRTIDYTINKLPLGSGTITFPGGAQCTVSDSADAHNTKYPKWNPDCFIPRCVGGQCSGDPANYGKSCTPIDGRATGGYNEVFIGPDYPGVTADCVYYTCGELPGELGHCIQHNKAGERTVSCSNSDDDKCTNDWCDGEGHCTDHEYIPGAHPAGVCMNSVCDPKTGIWTHTPNEGACCGNDILDQGEQCEVGVDGADSQCCVDCYFQTKCDDKNVCTDESCVKGKCVTKFNGDNSEKCPALDATNPDNFCRMPACVNVDGGKCDSMADPSKEGQTCKDAADECNSYVCKAGACVAVADNIGDDCTKPSSTGFDMTCKKLTCQKVGNVGKCLPVADDSKTCDDGNLCTIEKCVAGQCLKSGDVTCDAPKACFAPGVCNPATGKCTNAPLPAGSVCAPPSDAALPNCYQCSADQQCVLNTNDADCLCGNGKLDEGESCDWAMSAFKDCCSKTCTGCECGNGKIDAGEQCDYGIPSQLSCCNSKCEGCLCGNGNLDDGEECDPTAPESADICCNTNCTQCTAIIGKSYILPSVVGAGVLAAALILAALLAVVLRGDKAKSEIAAESGDFGVGTMQDNPVFVQSTNARNNPLFEDNATN